LVSVVRDLTMILAASLTKPSRAFIPLSARFRCGMNGLWVKCGRVRKTSPRAQSFVPVADCGCSARSIRVTAPQLCCLVGLVIVICFRCPSSLGQAPPSANMQVGHDSWTFKDGAPGGVECLAQTNDGFLWLGSESGLFRFDGLRFEPFNSPFGDQLLSTNLNVLFAPPSGGLWIGYTRGGFSFLDRGRVINYPGETGTVYDFTQDRSEAVWAATSSGLWRFDHLGWRHFGSEWNVPAGNVDDSGVDSEGVLWALAGGFGAQKSLI
jgi:hypothetical protein